MPRRAIYLALFLVLGSCLGYNYTRMLEAQPRGKRARMMELFKSTDDLLAAQLSANGSLPKMRPLASVTTRPRLLEEAGGMELMTMANDGIGLGMIDLFSPKGELPFVYYTSDERWILASAGPDEDYDINPAEDVDWASASIVEDLIDLTYDPSNGTFSDGDVWRSGPNPPARRP